MGSLGTAILVIAIGLIIAWTVRGVYMKRKAADEEHKENMAKIAQNKSNAPPDTISEADLYIQLFVIYAKDHVASTGRKISSNRLRPLEARFREGYQSFMSRGLPADLSSPFAKIKIALRAEGLMVETSGQ